MPGGRHREETGKPPMKITIRRLGMALVLAALAPDGPPKDPAIGTTYQVPYRVTNTNHYLVRVRVNGKGPFNFLVDSGAPALYVGTEAAKKIGIEPDVPAPDRPATKPDEGLRRALETLGAELSGSN